MSAAGSGARSSAGVPTCLASPEVLARGVVCLCEAARADGGGQVQLGMLGALFGGEVAVDVDGLVEEPRAAIHKKFNMCY